MIEEVRQRLLERGVDLIVTAAAQAAEGYDPTDGARPLRRVIQRQVENQVSRRLLAGVFSRATRIR